MSCKKDIDILSVGESLIDFIGHKMEGDIAITKDYHRYLGGSPTNVAMNCARLGLSVKLVATVGNDGLGSYIFSKLEENNVNTEHIYAIDERPTSVIFISKTTGTPEFIAFREADCHIVEEQLPDEVLQRSKIFHTTCFALSRQVARDTILAKAKKAYELGCRLSIDLNYSPQIWADREEAKQTIAEYCQYNPLVKISLDDMERIFGASFTTDEMFAYFHRLGVEVVCLTMGSQGVKLSEKGREVITLPALKIKRIMDATGAGDAFWSGFLYAYVNNSLLKECLQTALKLAALKLQNVGRLPEGSESILQLFK